MNFVTTTTMNGKEYKVYQGTSGSMYFVEVK